MLRILNTSHLKNACMILELQLGGASGGCSKSGEHLDVDAGLLFCDVSTTAISSFFPATSENIRCLYLTFEW
jgi:hypothetical protein